MNVKQHKRLRQWINDTKKKPVSFFRECYGYSPIKLKPKSERLSSNLRQQVYERDLNSCMNCGKTQEQERIDSGGRLSIHHIDGNHFHNVIWNLATLCRSCHNDIENPHTNNISPQVNGII